MINTISNVNTAISQFNVENAIHHAPNAMAAAQSNLQSQEIIKDGIRIAQTVQAMEAAEEVQRVHRKNEQERRNNQQNQNQNDSYEHSKNKQPDLKQDIAPVIHEHEIKARSTNFNFTA